MSDRCLLDPQATEALVVEKQARLRAETKEEDERRERISTTAQTAAIQQQHSKEMETERLARAKLEAEASMKAQVSHCSLWAALVVFGRFRPALRCLDIVVAVRSFCPFLVVYGD